MSKQLKKLEGDDLCEYLHIVIYGDLYEEGVRINWTMQDSIDVAQGLAIDGWEADPQTIFEIMTAWDQEDAETEAAEREIDELLFN